MDFQAEWNTMDSNCQIKVLRFSENLMDSEYCQMFYRSGYKGFETSIICWTLVHIWVQNGIRPTIETRPSHKEKAIILGLLHPKQPLPLKETIPVCFDGCTVWDRINRFGVLNESKLTIGNNGK